MPGLSGLSLSRRRGRGNRLRLRRYRCVRTFSRRMRSRIDRSRTPEWWQITVPPTIAMRQLRFRCPTARPETRREGIGAPLYWRRPLGIRCGRISRSPAGVQQVDPLGAGRAHISLYEADCVRRLVGRATAEQSRSGSRRRGPTIQISGYSLIMQRPSTRGACPARPGSLLLFGNVCGMGPDPAYRPLSGLPAAGCEERAGEYNGKSMSGRVRPRRRKLRDAPRPCTRMRPATSLVPISARSSAGLRLAEDL